MELSGKIARFLPMDEYKKRKLAATLRSAEIPMTPELYMAHKLCKGRADICLYHTLSANGSAFISCLSGFGDRDIFSLSGKRKMVKSVEKKSSLNCRGL